MEIGNRVRRRRVVLRAGGVDLTGASRRVQLVVSIRTRVRVESGPTCVILCVQYDCACTFWAVLYLVRFCVLESVYACVRFFVCVRVYMHVSGYASPCSCLCSRKRRQFELEFEWRVDQRASLFTFLCMCVHARFGLCSILFVFCVIESVVNLNSNWNGAWSNARLCLRTFLCMCVHARFGLCFILFVFGLSKALSI